jgi:type I restriction enzyme M protein
MSPLDRSDFKRLANNMSRAFRDSHGGGIVERFEAVSKLLFTKMVDERMVTGTWPHSPAVEQPAMQWRSGDVSRTVYERTRELWNTATGGANAKVLQGGKGFFPTDVEAVARVVKLLEPYRLDSLGVDVKGAAYEELLRDTFEKNDNQQYFTPRHLMDFIVEMVAPTPESIVCDPASGSGGFLVGALNYSAARFDGAVPQVHGVDIDERMAWVARINVFLHGGDPSAIVHLPGAGSLRPLPQIQKVLPRGGFTTILTNPPFGSDMTDQEALDGFVTGKARPTRRRGVLFIERCIELLQPGGTLAVVIDDSILNLDGNADIRELMRSKAIVEAVISLPDVTFMPYSTAKSSVVILSKRGPGHVSQGRVFMADIEFVGNRPNGDPLYQDVPAVSGVRPLQSDLPAVVEAWEAFKTTGNLPASASAATVFLADINAYTHEVGGDRLDVNYFHPTRTQAAAVLARATSPTYKLSELFDIDNSTVNVAETYGDTTVEWLGLGEIIAETGEYEPLQVSGDRIKSNAHRYLPGDILISKLRPKLRKIVLIPESSKGGVCSAELVVLRKKGRPAADVMAEYVAYALRSDLGYGQQVYQITGVGRPRVGMSALRNLRVPVPSVPEQRLIRRQKPCVNRPIICCK